MEQAGRLECLHDCVYLLSGGLGYAEATGLDVRMADGISSADLAKETEKLGTDTHYFPSFAQIEAFLKENCRPGDLLITMGAGDVVTIGENLLK